MGDKGNVDFDEPIVATGEQIEKLVNFMKTIFAENIVEVGNLEEIRTDRVGSRNRWPRDWINNERALLYGIEDTQEIVEKLGRTWLSVNIMRGQFVPWFQEWLSEKRLEIKKGNMGI